MVDQCDQLVVAQIPAPQPIDLVSAFGCLLDAALGGGARLAPGNERDVAAVVLAPEGQTARQVAGRLHAAAAILAGTALDPPVVEDDEEPELTFNQVRTHDDGSVSLGLGVDEQAARDLAAYLLGAFIPAMRELDAPNYLEFPAIDPATGQVYALLVVKPDGLTPHQARQRAEAEVAQLRRHIEELEARSG